MATAVRQRNVTCEVRGGDVSVKLRLTDRLVASNDAAGKARNVYEIVPGVASERVAYLFTRFAESILVIGRYRYASTVVGSHTWHLRP